MTKDKTLKAITLIAPIMLGLTFAAPVHAQDSLTEAQRKEVTEIIQQHLLDNPELIVDAMRILQMREAARQDEIAAQKAKEAWGEFSDASNAIVVGNPKGDITIVEFYDYQCGYCRRQHETTLALLEADKNIRYIYRPFPIRDVPGETPYSLIAANVAFAASKQGKFEELHNALFTDSPISQTELNVLFTELGIDANMVSDDMSNQASMDHIINNMEMADGIGIDGTPALIINGELHSGILDLGPLQEKIAIARKTN